MNSNMALVTSDLDVSRISHANTHEIELATPSGAGGDTARPHYATQMQDIDLKDRAEDAAPESTSVHQTPIGC